MSDQQFIIKAFDTHAVCALMYMYGYAIVSGSAKVLGRVQVTRFNLSHRPIYDTQHQDIDHAARSLTSADGSGIRDTHLGDFVMGKIGGVG